MKILPKKFLLHQKMRLRISGEVLGDSFWMTTHDDMDEIDLFGTKVSKKAQLLKLVNLKPLFV